MKILLNQPNWVTGTLTIVLCVLIFGSGFYLGQTWRQNHLVLPPYQSLQNMMPVTGSTQNTIKPQGQASNTNQSTDLKNSSTSATKEASSITVTGTLVSGGVECQAFRSIDGTLYTLTGNLAGHKQGDKVQIVGTPTELSSCMQGKTISIKKISAAQ